MVQCRIYLLLCSLAVCGLCDTLVTLQDTLPVSSIPEVSPSPEMKNEVVKDIKLVTEAETTTEPPTPPTTTPTPPTTTPTPPPPAPPTPAPAPTPLPPPDQGTWSFTEDKQTCIVVQFAAQLNVTYTKTVNDSTSLADVLLNVPANATVSGGNCTANATQWLTVSWLAPNTSVPNNLTLTFLRNDTTKNYALRSLNVSLTVELFPNSSYKNALELSHGPEWQTPLATSYRCAEPKQLNLTSETGSVAGLTLSRLQEEAFRTSPGDGFSAARECGGGDVPDAVPIAVGCALGGLVLVVLVAYLVGRRRSAARGYLSM